MEGFYPMPASFDDFIRERRYLKNVSANTIKWYQQSFNWLAKFPLAEDGVKQFVIAMREAGLKATSCNSRIRVANAYFNWAKLPLHINKLQEDHEVLPTFSTTALDRLLGYRPKTWMQKRLITIVCLLMDCGVRIAEALSVRRSDVDMDNLLIKIQGKGRKQRILPFSREMRKRLYVWLKEHEFELVFPTHYGTELGKREVLRDVKKLCNDLGIDPPRRTLHAFRHTFAVEYIRAGGGEFRLQKMLGHTSLFQTRKYVELCTQDLQDSHERISLLNKRWNRR
jgi:integrase/recombinase XerD